MAILDDQASSTMDDPNSKNTADRLKEDAEMDQSIDYCRLCGKTASDCGIDRTGYCLANPSAVLAPQERNQPAKIMKVDAETNARKYQSDKKPCGCPASIWCSHKPQERNQPANIMKVEAVIEPTEDAALSRETAASVRSMSLRRFDNLNPF